MSARCGTGFLVMALSPLVAVVALFLGVLWLEGVPVPRAGLPREAFEVHRCTWACHNVGCRHASVLPGALVDDDGLFGRAIAGLHRLGAVLIPGGRSAGYGAANLLVFCAIWPATMYGLWLVALMQRRKLRALRGTRS